ncbi:MAG: helix-turn-helix domain-containing protein [Candidatus Bathyarchaeia archaeon]
MSQNLILAKLIELGFTDQEARIYILLAKTGTLKAKDISRTLKINKVQVYRSLRNLQNRDFVESSLGCPAFFSATPFDKLIDLVAESKSSEAMLLKSNKGALLSLLGRMEQLTPNEMDKFTVVENANTIYSLIDQFFKKAQKEIVVMVDDAYKAVPNFDENHRITKANLKRGVKYRCIGKDNEQNHESTKRIMNDGWILRNFENRYSKIINNNFPCFFMRDEKELILSMEKDAFGYIKKIMITNNQALISLVKLFFEKTWCDSEISEIAKLSL